MFCHEFHTHVFGTFTLLFNLNLISVHDAIDYKKDQREVLAKLLMPFWHQPESIVTSTVN